MGLTNPEPGHILGLMYMMITEKKQKINTITIIRKMERGRAMRDIFMFTGFTSSKIYRPKGRQRPGVWFNPSLTWWKIASRNGISWAEQNNINNNL